MIERNVGGGMFGATALLLGLLASSGRTEDWPQYRGPMRNGVSVETGWLKTWPADGLEVLWEKEVGEGYSAVTVAKGRIYTMGLVTKDKTTNEKIWCCDAATGEVVWEHAYPSAATQYRGSRCTPTVDGKVVYTYGVHGELLCLDAETGKIVWQKNVKRDLGAQEPTYGYAASPVIVKDLVIVPVRIIVKDNPANPNHRSALLMAFDKATGDEKWRYFHESALLGGGYWTNGVSAVVDGQPCLVYATGEGCLGLDPATGAMQWQFKVSEADFRKAGKNRGCIAQEPVIQGDRIFFCAHFQFGEGYTIAIEVANKQVREVWRSDKLGNWGSSNVILKDHLYGIHHPDVGAANPLCCFRIDTGALLWTHKDVGRTLFVADGKLLSFDGSRLFLGEVSPTGYQELARSQLLYGPLRFKNTPTTDQIVPVLSNGRIYCRNMAGKLICLNVKDSPAKK